MDPMNIPAKFEVRSFTRSWDNRGYSKKLGSLRIRPLSFSPKFLMGFCSDEPVNIPAKFEVRSFTCSWDNRGYSKNLGSNWILPRSFFSQIFKWLLFGWTLWIYLPNLKFVPLPVPEIIGGRPIQKSLDRLWIRPRSLFYKIFMGLCSDEPFEYTCQIWSP